MDLFNAGQCLEVRFALALSINTYPEGPCVNTEIGMTAVRNATDLPVSGHIELEVFDIAFRSIGVAAE